MGGAGEDPPTCKMGTFFQIPLALTMPIGNNLQLNGPLPLPPVIRVVLLHTEASGKDSCPVGVDIVHMLRDL